MEGGTSQGLPTGTLTLLFSDIEGSTLLLQRLGLHYPHILTEHQRIVRQAYRAWQGFEVNTEGDSFFIVFRTARQAIGAAVEIQRALAAYPWPKDGAIRVRMGLHTGEPSLVSDDYIGLDVHRAARICAAAHGGQVLLSQTTRDLAEPDLMAGVSLRELGVHRLKDLHRFETLSQLVITSLPADFPPLRSLNAHPNNLPAPPTPLVGRSQEIATVRPLLLHERTRLVTLTGPGGVGKTRLSLALAEELLEDFPEGVYFVPLSRVSDPRLVLSTVAQTLGVRETSDQSIVDSLKDRIGTQRLLLVLDNFEQVIDAATQVADLLSACGQVKMLVTSREALRIRGEREFYVLPLSLPPPLPALQRSVNALEPLTPTVARITHYAAVELFIQRAQAVKPDFQVTNANAPAIAEICVRLDGLPLAIELAAARVRVFTPEAMLARLDEQLRFLTGGSRDLPMRQQTIRNVIAWSYDLLNPAEQTLFRRLACFQGGFTLDAVEAVLGGVAAEKGEEPGLDFLDGLTSLTDKSLLMQQPDENGEPRFSRLRMIRDFAFEKLKVSGEADQVQRRHTAFYAALAEQAEPKLRTAEQTAWLARLDRELDNLRAALTWSLSTTDDLSMGLRLVGALWRFWEIRAYYREGRRWLETVLQRDNERRAAAGPTAPHSMARGKALNGSAAFADYWGDHVTSRLRLEESLTIFRALDDKIGVSTVLNNLGLVAYYTDDNDLAWQYLQESLALKRELGDLSRISSTLGNLGNIAHARGDYAQARGLYKEALAIDRKVGDRVGMALTLGNIGRVYYHEGELTRAYGLTMDSLQVYQALGDDSGIAWCLDAFGALRLLQGDTAQALRLLAASDAHHERLGLNMDPIERREHLRHVATARASLGAEQATLVWDEGRHLSLPDAVRIATEHKSVGEA